MMKLIFVMCACLVAMMDVAIAARVLWRKDKEDLYLGYTMLTASVVELCYILRTLTDDYFAVSLFSSMYYATITMMLLCLLSYTIVFTRLGEMRLVKIGKIVLYVYGVIDVVFLMINPFHEFSLHYSYHPDTIALWQLKEDAFFYHHLAVCYTIVVVFFAMLLYRSAKTPGVYRMKYIWVLLGVLLIVVLNGIYMLQRDKLPVDISILFYSLIGYLLFWNQYYFSGHGLLDRVRQMLLDELDQPVLLFDREDELTMANRPAKLIFETDKHVLPSNFDEYVTNYGLRDNVAKEQEFYHYQWSNNQNDSASIYRVDEKMLRDKKARLIGRLLVFTDTSLAVDLLTGFSSKNSFEAYIRSNRFKSSYPVAVAILDVNRLSVINKEYGIEKGDEAISFLAQQMRKHCPKGSYFARLEDANLLAVCSDTNHRRMKECLEKIRREMEECEDFPGGLELQSAVSIATVERPEILKAAGIAMGSMRAKKLMDGSSAHSSLLDSLAQTLAESDSTTKEHVQRTKYMGELLGKRLGFSDVQLSDLALLCLLHDIGKLGIPLEILNKPGRLNSAEWDTLKSHVEKGYRIAKACKELEGIADCILHHHESWNGKGYPDGLTKESIPLLSRVIAVVDSYDAMTNDRPYHKAVDKQAAKDELRRCAGIQFDPYIVSEFLGMLEELEEQEQARSQQDIVTDEEMVQAEQKQRDVSDFDTKEKTTAADETNQRSNLRSVKEIFQKDDSLSGVCAIPYCRYRLTEDYQIYCVDEHFEAMTGYSEEDVKQYHLSHNDLIPAEDRAHYWDVVRQNTDSTQEAYLEHRLLRKDGTTRDIICLGKNVYDSALRMPMVDILFFDVAKTVAIRRAKEIERQAANRSLERWEHVLRKDSLTGLLNHEAFINDVEVELLNNTQKVALVILDVDNFKSYNDNYGHLEGDHLLTQVAVGLQKAAGENGLAGRLGGDEFSAILPVPLETTEKELDHIAAAIFQTVMASTNTLENPATISMGACLSEGEAGFNNLYQKADAALYRAKENGRKCYSL